MSNLSVPLLSIVGINADTNIGTERNVEDLLIQCKDTITSLIIDRFYVKLTGNSGNYHWFGSPTFWRSFSNLSFFDVDLSWFFNNPETVPKSLNYIASSSQAPVTIALRRLKIHKFCIEKGKRIAQSLTRWCLSHSSPSPIKRIALMKSWQVLMGEIKHIPNDVYQIKDFIEGVYNEGMNICDENGVNFYDKTNEKMYLFFNFPRGKCSLECTECLKDAISTRTSGEIQ